MKKLKFKDLDVLGNSKKLATNELNVLRGGGCHCAYTIGEVTVTPKGDLKDPDHVTSNTGGMVDYDPDCSTHK